MFSKIVLCVTNHKLIAGKWRLGRLLSHQVFPNDPQGQENFDRFLQRERNIRIYLLVDAIEEDYRLETLPHATGTARREMVERRLNHLYRNAQYRTAQFIGRDTGKRRDDRFIFVALNNADFLQGWVDLIQAQQAPLVGIYLLPTVSQRLVARMKPAVPHLLLSEYSSSGLRQSYLFNSRLRISRLAPFAAEEQSSLGDFYTTETEKTRLYLVSQRYISRDTKLGMVLPAHQDPDRTLCHDIERAQGVSCTTMDMLKLSKSSSLDPVLLRDHPELLHMHLLANGAVPGSLAPDKLVKNYRLNVLRLGINMLSAAALLLGLTFSAVYLRNSIDNAAAAQRAAVATQQQEQLYQEVAKSFPEAPLPANDLKAAVELADAIAVNAKLPDQAMQILSQAVSASPEIDIERLHWMLSNEDDPRDGDRVSATATATGATTASFVADKALLYEVMFVDGEIHRFTGDYRAALESVNRLAERLRANPAVAQVVILQAPVNVSSYSNLQGSTADERTAQVSSAPFKLRVILKHEEAAT